MSSKWCVAQVQCVVAPRVLIAVGFEETGILWWRFGGTIAMVIERGKCGGSSNVW